MWFLAGFWPKNDLNHPRGSCRCPKPWGSPLVILHGIHPCRTRSDSPCHTLKIPIPIHSIYGNPQKRPNCVFSEMHLVTIGNYQTLFINNGIIMGTIQPWGFLLIQPWHRVPLGLSPWAWENPGWKVAKVQRFLPLSSGPSEPSLAPGRGDPWRKMDEVWRICQPRRRKTAIFQHAQHKARQF